MSYKNKRESTALARKIWVHANGPIPKDVSGRSYEIHHIDGNWRNNSLENLACVSIQEHYEIHYKQCDWGACRGIAIRMKMSPEVISEISRKAGIESSRKRIEDGTHNFLDKEFQRKRIEDGTHNFLGGEIQRKNNLRRSEEGNHQFLGGEIQRKAQKKIVEKGNHHFQDKEAAKERAINRIKKGNHNLVGGATCRDKNGNVVQVPKEVYRSQDFSKNPTEIEFAHINSIEGRRRKCLQ
jgi:hypothetical protein